MRIMVINGPNLNMLGVREPDIYGTEDYDDLCFSIEQWADELGFKADVRQSNYEGEIIDFIHEVFDEDYDGLIINPAAYTHYSYAIRDALAILSCPIVEVHLSDIHNREGFRNISVMEDVVTKQICGKGFESYKEALQYFFELL